MKHKLGDFLAGLVFFGILSLLASQWLLHAFPTPSNPTWEERLSDSTRDMSVDDISKTYSPYAYVFILWRVNLSKEAYKGSLANILVAAKLLRQNGSKADVLAFFKFSNDSVHTRLPDEEVQLLTAMRIQVRYLPKETQEEKDTIVYGTMFNKFVAFNLTEYRRVMYLDSDVMPLNNLDYLMELSDKKVLKDMIVVATQREPSNGGIFVVTPNVTAYQDIVETQKQHGSKLGREAGWDRVEGWGHTIIPPDQWETNTLQTRGTYWSFWAANADQGFLYHYCKYVMQSCTQILARQVINFGPSKDTGSRVEHSWTVRSTHTSPLTNRTSRRRKPYTFPMTHCGSVTGYVSKSNWPGCVPPYSDFHHFTGKSKPWLQDRAPVSRRRIPASTPSLWWHTLVELRDSDGLNLTSLGIRLPY